MNRENIIEEIKKMDWVLWLERFYQPFIASCNFSGVDKKYFEKLGLKGFGYNANLYQFPNIYLSPELTEKNERAVRKYFKNHSIFTLCEILKKQHKENIKNIKKLIKNRQDPLKKIIVLREIFRTYYPFLWLIEALERYYKEEINKIAPKYVKGDIGKWAGDVSVPKKKNAYVLMQEALLKNPVEQVLKKYYWLKSRDGFSDFYTVEELAEIKKDFKKTEAHEIKIQKEIKPLVEELKEFTFFRTDRTDKFYEAMGTARPILQELANYIKVSFENLSYYDLDSIIAGQPEKFSFPFTYAYFSGKQIILQGNAINFSGEKGKNVKGSTAYPGKARGIVRIIKHPSELGKISEGEILVAQSTFPSFISAMHKASAFVTDEGGITSHAAIIARELKKPCVIGTKNATKILKDGDMVEVDADNGTVKIINSTN
jgi:phosphohistidine swiveling domain-containing protein